MSLKHGSPQYCIGGDLRSYILADRKSRGLFGKPQRTKDVVLMGGRFLESLKKTMSFILPPFGSLRFFSVRQKEDYHAHAVEWPCVGHLKKKRTHIEQ